jgi:uncharacterized C2H2 Zn-finger protein
MAPHKIPSRDGGATASCPVCGRRFAASPNQRYCSHACRATAWRRRHQPPAVPVVEVPPARTRRAVTVYECESCGVRALGEQRCSECGAFMRKAGLGGLCPHCDEPVTIGELLDGTP